MFRREKLSQKEQERIALKSFLRCLRQDKYTIIDFEKPDFLLYFAKNKIGVEVVEYVNEKEIKMQTAINKLEENLNKNLNNSFKSLHYDILLNWKYYNSNMVFGNKKAKNKFMLELMEYIKHHLPNNNCEYCSINNNINELKKYSILNKYIFSIKIRRYDEIFKKTLVRSSRADYLEFDYDILEKRIEEKRDKIFDYSKAANNLWLLIVSYDEDFFNFVDFDAVYNYKLKKFEGKDFDRIYFHQLNTKNYINLLSI